MTWIAHLRQRSTCLLAVVALVLLLSLAACGEQANASSSSATNSYSTSQQYQPTHAGNNHSTTMQNVDQQVQGILRQLDGAQNDVNTSSAAASQDGGQP